MTQRPRLSESRRALAVCAIRRVDLILLHARPVPAKSCLLCLYRPRGVPRRIAGHHYYPRADLGALRQRWLLYQADLVYGRQCVSVWQILGAEVPLSSIRLGRRFGPVLEPVDERAIDEWW